MTITAQQLFAALPGRWRFSRVITGQGSAIGEARFEPVSGTELHYREDGTLTLDSGYTGPAYREYRYQLDGEVLRICFPDGRTMHTLRPDAAEATDVHLCGADVYTGHYRLADQDTLHISYQVAGPHKDFTIATVFRRVSG
ncbi:MULTISPECIES: DUF6314 family protein [unclassified Crossiella]|uniref:DUF6314 family protein n=1 Tax=unclassified Crossiella TaxID=2620835 RepID=UPI001FFFEF24|nr:MULTISPECIES: DUF6314 family protein [unclassified Crossiella]MCK2244289.1 DUF6314 family protein [Crossiella sp. S99.2]MCK2257883.1 DUF6314 family protein [Crossiella sp. S99.1]